MKGLQSSKIEREQRLKLSRMKESKREQRADTHKPKRKQFKTMARILIFFLFSTSCGGFLSPRIIFAEALPDLPLEFDPDITFADNVISFMAASGAATTNIDVLNDLYANFSGSGYGVADLAGLYDVVDISTGVSVGLTDAEIFSHLGDQDYFTENGYDLQLKDYNSWKTKLDTSQSLSKYGAEFIHEATLSTTGNPWEWDWAEIIKTYLKRGDIPFSFDIVQKDIGTTITKTFLDVLDTVIDFWSPNIRSSTPINFQIDENLMVSNGTFFGIGYKYYYRGSYRWTQSNNLYLPEHTYVFSYSDSTDATRYFVVNLTNSNISYTSVINDSQSGTSQHSYTVQNWNTRLIINIFSDGNVTYEYLNGTAPSLHFNSQQDMVDYINDVKNGVTSEPSLYYSSPDLINPNFSNLNGEDLERMSPSIEQGKAIRPIPQSDYNNFANTANGNTEEGNDPQNAPLLKNLIDRYINTDPNTNPEPNPGPNYDPDPNARPVSPEQPDYPDEPDLTDEDINESLKAVTPDLTDIFPFCIPWDIKAIFTKFSASRQAPYFEFPIKSELFGIDEVIVIDLSMFDEQAAILRYMELILFIIALAVATRKLIGA